MAKSMSRGKKADTAKPVAKRRTLYALVAGTAIVILLGIFFSSQKPPAQPKSGYESLPVAGQLSSDRALSSASPFFDFGKISMAAGNVSHPYSIKNISGAALTITRISTSCMCTTATLITPAGKRGPFGMPGHGPVPELQERFAPGETARVEVVFDPAAHGPAGIGQTDRTVTIINDAGPPLVLRFSAMVTP